MRLISRITDHDFLGGDPIFIDHVSRQASRGVLVDNEFNVAMMFMSQLNLYKLPGGGIEEGEDKQEAFLREIKEETGFDSEILHELGYIEEHKNRNQFMQLSYCFIARVLGHSADTMLTESEIELGMQVRWMHLREAIREMEHSAQRCDDHSTKFMILRDRILLEEASKRLDVGEQNSKEAMYGKYKRL
ncbi:NUDIX domain-containing protein [Paenibacillus sp. S3N08]|uniref:NUDIX domain-containing protein n=1 Tax=Paenibacillus agricola TaxID=2716264 RepID=A0ABX0JI36_9BACL|nr:NUDIX domain-containing protein [Paenibacillus agricola]